MLSNSKIKNNYFYQNNALFIQRDIKNDTTYCIIKVYSIQYSV